MKYHKAEKDTDIANNVIARQLETGYRVGILKTQALLAKKGKVLGYAEMERKITDTYCRTNDPVNEMCQPNLTYSLFMQK